MKNILEGLGFFSDVT